MEEDVKYEEADLVQLSALQHLVFCERQCALIHIEQVWKDNPLTLEGAFLHHRTDEEAPRREVRGNLVICRSLPLRSFSLGISGRADVVEFHRIPGEREHQNRVARQGGVRLEGLPGFWSPFPVEYKRGKPKPDLCDEVQLCAQAMCLEEMLGATVEEGALFYGALQRRHDVKFDAALRDATRSAARRLHELLASGVTPLARKEPKCRSCSLLDVCLPGTVGARHSAQRYLTGVLAGISEDRGGGKN